MKKIIASVLAVLLVFTEIGTVYGFSGTAEPDSFLLQSLVNGSASYMLKSVSCPKTGSVGGEWAVLGLARSSAEIPADYFESYYETVRIHVTDAGGVLHEKKYTEYSRTILGLTAIGADPRNVAGYNLLTPLGDYEKTIRQGLNGPVWALIALDSGNYEMPENKEAAVQATRQMYVDEILARQLSDGGFNLTGKGSADPDMTAMALQALAKYTDQEKVSKAVSAALQVLSSMQNENGSYASWGTENSESTAQVLVALCELGIDIGDTRFVKNGNSLLDALLSYRKEDGSFTHVKGGREGSNQMAAEQGFYALTAVWRAACGRSSLYRMTDVTEKQYESAFTDVAVESGKTGELQGESLFHDIDASEYKEAISALAQRKIVSGMGDGSFQPEKTLTRAQFCSIVVNGLTYFGVGTDDSDKDGGASGKTGQDAGFYDVEEGQWYRTAVLWAAGTCLVKGYSDGTFRPENSISREEAAALLTNAAKLCGLDTGMTDAQARDLLAPFGDYTASAVWARKALAFCCRVGILDGDAPLLEPKRLLTRGEMAQMFCKLLMAADWL